MAGNSAEGFFSALHDMTAACSECCSAATGGGPKSNQPARAASRSAGPESDADRKARLTGERSKVPEGHKAGESYDKSKDPTADNDLKDETEAKKKNAEAAKKGETFQQSEADELVGRCREAQSKHADDAHRDAVGKTASERKAAKSAKVAPALTPELVAGGVALVSAMCVAMCGCEFPTE